MPRATVERRCVLNRVLLPCCAYHPGGGSSLGQVNTSIACPGPASRIGCPHSMTPSPGSASTSTSMLSPRPTQVLAPTGRTTKPSGTPSVFTRRTVRSTQAVWLRTVRRNASSVTDDVGNSTIQPLRPSQTRTGPVGTVARQPLVAVPQLELAAAPQRSSARSQVPEGVSIAATDALPLQARASHSPDHRDGHRAVAPPEIAQVTRGTPLMSRSGQGPASANAAICNPSRQARPFVGCHLTA